MKLSKKAILVCVLMIVGVLGFIAHNHYSHNQVNQFEDTGATFGRTIDWSLINAAGTYVDNLTASEAELNQLAGVTVGGNVSGDIIDKDSVQTNIENKTFKDVSVVNSGAQALLTLDSDTDTTIEWQKNSVSKMTLYYDAGNNRLTLYSNISTNDLMLIAGDDIIKFPEGKVNINSIVLLDNAGTLQLTGGFSVSSNLDVDGIANLDNTDIDGTVNISSTLDIQTGSSTTTRVAPTGTFVNNASGDPNVSNTEFDIDANVTEDTWESIGPTGSGADNIWTGLDGVPSDVDWIRIRLWSDMSTANSSAINTNSIYIRQNGSAEVIGADTMVDYIDIYATVSNDRASSIVEVTVPVSSVKFDLYWAMSGFSAASMRCHVVGWGFNP